MSLGAQIKLDFSLRQFEVGNINITAKLNGF